MFNMVLRRVKKLVAWVLAGVIVLWLAAGAYWVLTAV